MIILNCVNIKKSFTKEIINNATFAIKEKEKAGLTGINGAGKTTIFKIITGEVPKDEGSLVFKQNIKLSYMSQTPPAFSNTIYQEMLIPFADLINMEKEIENLSKNPTPENIKKLDRLNHEYELQGGFLYKSKIKGVIKGLGFNENTLIGNLSGGQKTLVSMAKLLLIDADLLLLDEPTNHLDLRAITWLEGFLRDYKGALLIISHDRYFINKIATKIIELENKVTTTYNGNYDYYLEKKQRDRDIQSHHFSSQQQQIKKLEKSITTLRSFSREKSFKRAQSKEKALSKIERIAPPTAEAASLRLNLVPKTKSGNDVLRVRELSVRMGERLLFENVNFDINKGEKIALIGSVGLGKTTLFKALLGLVPKTGHVDFGTKVETAYYEQHQDVSLNPKNTIFEEIHSAYPQMNNFEIRSALAPFLFFDEDMNKKISALSGGEKARVLLTKIMLEKSNFLLLDEPTNHLDLKTKEVLEEALINFEGTCLYISHDRYFINKTATKVMELTPSGVNIFLGNYDYYTEKKQNPQILQKEESIENNKSRNKYQYLREEQAKERKIKSRIAKIKTSIEETEKNIAEMDVLLKEEQEYNKLSEIYNKKCELEEILLSLYEELEKLTPL